MNHANSSPRSQTERRPSRRGKVFIILLVLLLIAIGVVMVVLWNQRGTTDTPQEFSKESMEKAIYSAAILENNQFDEAIENYQQLVTQFPDHHQAKKNLAIACIAKLQQQIEFLSNTNYDPKVIRAALPELIDRTEKAVQEAMKSESDRADTYRLDAILREKRSSLLDPILSGDEKFELYDKLKQYVSEYPNDLQLLVKLDEAAESIIAFEPKVGAETIEPLWKGYKANPRNLVLLCSLMERMQKEKDPRIFELVPELVALLRPFEWLWGNERPPAKLQELLDAVELAKSDAEKARFTISAWVNKAKLTQGYDSDRRRAVSNVLASIDLTDAQAFIASQNATTTTVKPAFASFGSQLPNAQGARCLDWNLDDIWDLVSWNKNRLAIGTFQANWEYQETASIELPGDIQGIAMVDLYRVDSFAREKALGKKEAQHDAVRDILAFGPEGVCVVTFAPPIGDKPSLIRVEKETDERKRSIDLGLSGLTQVTQVLPVDWDADSDLDLVCIANGKLVLKQNNGNRTFLDAGPFSILPDDDWPISAAVAVDYDRDVDIDIVLSGPKGVAVMENILHGQFKFQKLDTKWAPIQGAQSLVVGEFDNNYSWDFVAQSADGVHSLTTSTLASSVVAPKMNWHYPGSSGMLSVGDWNNDGFLDAVSGSKSGLHVLLNRGNGELVSSALVADQDCLASVCTSDLDGDGWLDLISVCDGKVSLYRNESKNANHYAEFRLKGISDPGGGGNVNHYAIGSVIELYSANSYQARLVEDASIHFGLGTDTPFTARIIFPNGLTQNILYPKIDKLIEEKQVPKGSCPFLYGWDGAKWALVTDLLWNAPLGLQYAKGKPLPDRRWEYLFIPGASLQPHQDALELRITEELWEAAYFDHVALHAVDHPKEVQVFSNEKVGPPSIAQPGLWMVRDRLPLRSAKDKFDKDWTQELLNEDRVFAVPFRKFVCQGIVETHWTELDFGPLDLDRDSQLYLTGWIYPTNTSINIGIDQNPDVDAAIPPSLWTVGVDGEFHEAIPFTGFPGGKPKTIVIPLKDLFATQDHRIRIQHSSEIYWDRAFAAYGEWVSMDKTVPLSLESAELRYRGFSAELPRKRSEPHWYDYQSVLQEPQWPPMNGVFTRLGSVTDWIAKDDDRLVVMGAGDEMRVRFHMPDVAIPDGWVRDYVLHNVGWDKDADLNTLEGQSSLPIPFSSMQVYPPSSAQDLQKGRAIEAMHRDVLNRKQSFERFWHPRVESGASTQ